MKCYSNSVAFFTTHRRVQLVAEASEEAACGREDPRTDPNGAKVRATPQVQVREASRAA